VGNKILPGRRGRRLTELGDVGGKMLTGRRWQQNITQCWRRLTESGDVGDVMLTGRHGQRNVDNTVSDWVTKWISRWGKVNEWFCSA